MGAFSRKPLELLDGIYRFVGGLKGANSVDLASDISLVHDVSRQSERAGYGGYFGRLVWGGSDTVNGGPDETIITRINDIQPLLPFDNEMYELWITQAHWQCQSVDIADIAQVNLITGRDSISGPAGTPRDYIQVGTNQAEAAVVAHWENVYDSTNASGTSRGGGSTAPILPRPWRVGPGSFLAWSVRTTASATVYFTTELWAGPLGSRPPGMG